MTSLKAFAVLLHAPYALPQPQSVLVVTFAPTKESAFIASRKKLDKQIAQEKSKLTQSDFVEVLWTELDIPQNLTVGITPEFKISHQAEIKKEKETKEQNVKSFTSNIDFIKDKWAETDMEKIVLDKIKGRIEKEYSLSKT